MADLIGSGVPIEGESGVGYLMRSGYDLPPLMFTRSEMVARVAGARMIRAWGGAAMAQAAEEALVKIEDVLPDTDRNRANSIEIHAFTMPQMTDDVRQRIDELEAAIDTKTRLILTYRDKDNMKTNRPVRPLGLWFWGKVWTLVAWCELRNDFRIFRLDRIDAATPDGHFKPENSQALRLFYAREAAKGHERRGT
jgi:predicted DNA-binding transcriptional regulator YafY